MTATRAPMTHVGIRKIYTRSVGSFVPRLTQKAFEKYGFSTVSLLTDWAVIAGPELANYTRPERLKWPRKIAIYSDTDDTQKGRPGATLILHVDPARALDVQYGTAQLIERINGYFGYNAVTDIRILQTPVNPPTPDKTIQSQPATPPDQKRNKLKTKEKTESGTHIQDDGLRDALARLEQTFA